MTIEGGPNLTTCNSAEICKSTIQDKLYHLLTDKKTFTCEGIRFYHYNAAVELYLQDYKNDYDNI